MKGPLPSGAWRSSLVRWGLLALVLLPLSLALDPWAWRVLRWPGIYDGDAGRLLRVVGFLGSWWLAALLVLQAGRPTAVRRRGAALLALAPTLAALAAELLKLLLRRERPGLTDALYHFRPWQEQTWSAAGLGLPSSHAAVAFAGTTLLGLLLPRWRWTLALLALGCAWTRVAAGAHFLSDAVAGALLGVAVGSGLHGCWGVRAAAAASAPAVPAADAPPSAPRG